MLRIDLVPSLDSCIETVARREYQEAKARLLAGEADEELQQRVELLRMFLETMDFRKLRKQSEVHLAAGKRVKFTVYLHKGRPQYRLHLA